MIRMQLLIPEASLLTVELRKRMAQRQHAKAVKLSGQETGLKDASMPRAGLIKKGDVQQDSQTNAIDAEGNNKHQVQEPNKPQEQQQEIVRDVNTTTISDTAVSTTDALHGSAQLCPRWVPTS